MGQIEMITLKQMNEQNAAFWAKQKRLLDERIQDPMLVKILRNRLQSPFSSVKPPQQLSIEAILEEAVRAKDLVLEQHTPSIRADARREQARRAGKSKGPDALQKLIIELLRRNPKLTTPQVLEELRAFPRPNPVDDLEEDKIIYKPGPGKALKEAPISGLKDRVSRAKKFLNSR